MDKLINALGESETLFEENINAVLSLFREKSLKKGTVFLAPGKEQRKVGFILSGVFRYYYLDYKGLERTKYFATDNDFLFSMSAFILKKPSEFYIESLTDTLLLVAEIDDFRNLIESDDLWRNLYFRKLESYYILKEKREAELLLYDSKERYKRFLKEYPDLPVGIKQHYIASYLGMTPETLSRIRKELSLS